MNTPAPFSEFTDALKRMTPEHKNKLIEAYAEFARLKELCTAKGFIETLPSLSGIKILKMTPEVKAFKKVVKILQPGGFKFVDGTKK